MAGKVLDKELGETTTATRRIAMGRAAAPTASERDTVMSASQADGLVPATVFDQVAPELTSTYAEALLNASGDEVNAVLEDLEAIRTDVLERPAPVRLDPGLARRSRSPRRTGS